MEPMIRKKLKSRCATHSPSTPRRFKNSDVFVKCSPNHRTRSLKPRETMLRSKTRSFQEIDDKGVNVLKLHQHDTRNSAPSSCTNLASNFSRALPSYFKSGKDKNQIKYEVFTTSHQLKNLLRPTLSLDASCIRYEVYRSSDESDPIECDSRKNRGSIEDRYRKRSGIPLELSIERNLTHFGNSSACISSDKNISSADSSSLHSFIEKFLVSRETGKHGQMNSVKTEKKAVKVLGAMFCFFFLCWSSFFVMNTFIGMCRNCRFSSTLFKCFLWLGYSSSIVNPIIYTIFNKAFKQTFQSLLTCSSRCLLTNPYKANYNRGRRRCWDSSNKKGVDVTFYNRRSTTTTTTTSSSYCRRMSSRKSIAVSEECLDKHHVRATP